MTTYREGPMQPSYFAPLVLIVTGAAMLVFGILAAGDGQTVVGTVLGVVMVGAGVLVVPDVWRARRELRRRPSPLSHRQLRNLIRRHRGGRP